jgi:tetratricopeptide (TPR) repeat protein
MLRKETLSTSRKHALEGSPLHADIKGMTDDELLAKLRSYDVNIDKTSLAELCDNSLSAEELTMSLLKDRVSENPQTDLTTDWTWFCLAELWTRWFPDKLCFEFIDEKMQEGYKLSRTGKEALACSLWLDALSGIWDIIDKTGIQSFKEFDKRFGSVLFLNSWLQDLEMELGNAGLQDPSFYTSRITLCEKILQKFPSSATGESHDHNAGNWKRALGESYFAIGQTDKTDSLFREWLKTDPQWGWGWIGWADCTSFGQASTKDLVKSEIILQEGLSVTDVRDRLDLMERLADIYADQGKIPQARQLLEQVNAEYAALNKQLQQSSAGIPRHKNMANLFSQNAMNSHSHSQKTALANQTVGKKEPCPCGSGKKFKRCCGSGL